MQRSKEARLYQIGSLLEIILQPRKNVQKQILHSSAFLASLREIILQPCKNA